jgi:hypothetical protein
MRFHIVSAVAALGAMLPLASHAADQLSYSYLDPAYITTDVDGFNKDVDGFALRGSLEVTDRFFGWAGYTTQSTEIGNNDLDYNTMSIGGGYAWPLSPTADVYGRLGYIKEEVEFAGFNADDDGFLLGAGVRGRVAQEFELEGGLNYVDLSDSGDDTSLYAAGRWYFTPSFAAGLEAELGDNVTTYGIGVRWNFAP